MIVVRNVFRLKFGKARDMKELWNDWRTTGAAMGAMRGYRTLTDYTGESYTFVLEVDFDSLASYENSQAELFADPAWRAFYTKVTPLVESGYREIYTLVDSGDADSIARAASGMATTMS